MAALIALKALGALSISFNIFRKCGLSKMRFKCSELSTKFKVKLKLSKKRTFYSECT